MSAKKFEFEGQLRSISEIHALVPALTASTIRKHLQAGRTTRQAMLTFDPIAARRRGGRRGRIATERAGYF